MIKNITIATFLLLSSASADFIRDNDLDVVNDTKTCLMWQDTSDKRLNWESAIDYCETLAFAGYEDWRLPNFNELYSIVDKNVSETTINSSFTNIASGMFNPNIYWSSTSYNQDNTKAWTIKFENADNTRESKTDTNYIRCVRDNH
jgi:hypothetical protein